MIQLFHSISEMRTYQVINEMKCSFYYQNVGSTSYNTWKFNWIIHSKENAFFFFLKWWHAIWIIITLWGNYLNILILGNIFNPVINFAFSNYLRYSTFHQWEIFNKKLRVQMNTFLQKPRLNIWMIIDFWWVKKRYTYPYLYCASD